MPVKNATQESVTTVKKKKLTAITAMHYGKLVLRSVLFLVGLILYVINRIKKPENTYLGFSEIWFLIIIFVVYGIELVSRLFPSKLESMGSQKHFKRNYQPTGTKAKPNLPSWKRTLAVVVAWVALNGAIGALYFTHVIDQGILVLVSLAYGVCDMICILFFCPFQTWFLKNRCCNDCRIYNWDSPMLVTPLVFIPNPFTLVLVAVAVATLIRWEIVYHTHPERFSSRTNACIDCKNCEEKLCKHKKQLKGFWQKNKKFFTKIS